MKTWLALILASVGFLAWSPEAPAQKIDKDFFEMAEHGFRFKPLREYRRIPPQTADKEFGVVGKMEGKELQIQVKGRGAYPYKPTIDVYRFVDKKTAKVKRSDKGDSITYEYERVDIAEYVGSRYKGVNEKETVIDERVQINKELEARHRQWAGSTDDGTGEFIVDVWSYEVYDADVHVVFTVPEKYAKKWTKVFTKSAETFEIIEVRAAPTLRADMTYEERLAFYDQDERNLGGWRAYPTPSKKYIVKYDGDDEKFIEKVIERLEASRRLFEEDFPPTEPMTHVSVVRICSTEDVFHSYGETPPGVGGWFSPSTTELVLYDGKDRDRNATYSVMSHEAFHQYCHFLFEESAAHRWFDEGHGDYYGGAKMGRSAKSPMIITPKMPAGFDRLGPIREIVRTGKHVPIEEHVNYDHRTWSNLGTNSYSQSWAIVYFLRQGTLGNVPSKIWKKEYADIIPNYMRVLSEEFQKAYDEEREKEIARRKAEYKRLKEQRDREKKKREKARREREKKKGEQGEDPSEESPEGSPETPGQAPDDSKPDGDETEAEPTYNIPNSELNLSERTTRQIWKKAIDASWGQIDIDEFELYWMEFVKKHI